MPPLMAAFGLSISALLALGSWPCAAQSARIEQAAP